MGKMVVKWISPYWKSLKCTLCSLQYYNLQCLPPMICVLGWNIVCIHSFILDVFSVGFLLYSLAYNAYHKTNPYVSLL